MMDQDPVLSRLATLATIEPPHALSQQIRETARKKLQPQKLHPIWSFAVASSIIVYLGWALYFTSQLY